MFFRDRLRYLRKVTGATQKEMSEALGILVRSYCRYEEGSREPELTTLCKLADYFQVSLDFLVGRGVYQHWDWLLANRDDVADAIYKATGITPITRERMEARPMQYIDLLNASVTDINIINDQVYVTIVPKAGTVTFPLASDIC